MNMHLRIEQLVIDGVVLSRSQAVELQMAAQRELTRLLQSSSRLHIRQSETVRTLRAPAIHVSEPVHPVDLGQKIACSVHECLTRSHEQTHTAFGSDRR
jgi:hypothetical protein